MDVLRIVHVLEFEHQDPMFGDSLEPVPRSYDKIWAAVEMIIYFVHFETINSVLLWGIEWGHSEGGRTV